MTPPEHALLKIVRGIPKYGSTTTSNAEPGVEDEIDLLDPNGFGVKPIDGYIMQRPELKGGGVWADNPNTDGRVPIAGAVGNVNETIDATLACHTMTEIASLQARLDQMVTATNGFFRDPYAYISPVYIVSQLPGEVGAALCVDYEHECCLS